MLEPTAQIRQELIEPLNSLLFSYAHYLLYVILAIICIIAVNKVLNQIASKRNENASLNKNTLTWFSFEDLKDEKKKDTSL